MIKRSPSATAEGLFCFAYCYIINSACCLLAAGSEWLAAFLLVNAFLKSISFFYTHPKSFTLPT
jgi:hypothetical protein